MDIFAWPFLSICVSTINITTSLYLLYVDLTVFKIIHKYILQHFVIVYKCIFLPFNTKSSNDIFNQHK